MLQFLKKILFPAKKPVAPMPLWMRLDTKWQWPVGHREHVEITHEGKVIDGYIYAVDLYSVRLYDEKEFFIGTYPKECITKIFDNELYHS